MTKPENFLKDNVEWGLNMQDATQWLQMNVQKHISSLSIGSSFIEVAGYRINRENHGAPNSPEITLNDAVSSRDIPQAWSNIVNGKIEWLYNFLWAITEYQYLIKNGFCWEIPGIEDWMNIIEWLSWDAEDKAIALNIPFSWYHNNDNHDMEVVGGGAYLLSSTEYKKDPQWCWFIAFLCMEDDARDDVCDKWNGLSLRFIYRN